MVVALTRRHFADLAAATGLSGTFAELERLLAADFGEDGDRYRHREVITALLEPWFAVRRIADVERDLAGTSVLWSAYRGFADLASAGANPDRARHRRRPFLRTHAKPSWPCHAARQENPPPVTGTPLPVTAGTALPVTAGPRYRRRSWPSLGKTSSCHWTWNRAGAVTRRASRAVRCGVARPR